MGEETVVKRNIFVAAIAAEWVRARTVRSTFITLGFYAVVSLAFSVMWGSFGRTMHENGEYMDAIQIGHSGSFFGFIAILVLSILSVTGEYTQGTISSSLLAVPNRYVYYLAKLFVNTAIVGVAALVVIPVSFFVAQLVMGSPLALSFGDDLVFASLIGGVLYVVGMCVLAMGVATILRSSVASIGVILPWVMAISTILVSWSKTTRIAQFFPDIAGSLLLASESSREVPDLTPWGGILVLAAWALLFSSLGMWSLRRRDVG